MTNSPRLRTALAVSVVVLTTLSSMALVVVPAAADKMPDIHLASAEKFTTSSKRPMVNNAPAVIGTPTGCAAPPNSATCDVYKLTLDFDPDPNAVNFVVAKLTWDPVSRVPSIVTPAIGLTFGSAVDYSMYVWTMDVNEAGTAVYTRDSTVTGGLANPELIGFNATRDTYFITVQLVQGASLGYDFEVGFSNEKFATPLEVLDPAYTTPAEHPDLGSDDTTPPQFFPGDEEPAPLDETAPSISTGGLGVDDNAATVAANDADFEGFRTSVDQRLAGNLASFTPGVNGPALPKPKPPSGVLLVFWLLIAPLLFAALLAFTLRRRRPAALSD